VLESKEADHSKATSKGRRSESKASRPTRSPRHRVVGRLLDHDADIKQEAIGTIASFSSPRSLEFRCLPALFGVASVALQGSDNNAEQSTGDSEVDEMDNVNIACAMIQLLLDHGADIN
jgi:hypothetical protein